MKTDPISQGQQNLLFKLARDKGQDKERIKTVLTVGEASNLIDEWLNLPDVTTNPALNKKVVIKPHLQLDKPTKSVQENITYGQAVNLVHAEWLKVDKIVCENNEEEFKQRVKYVSSIIKGVKE